MPCTPSKLSHVHKLQYKHTALCRTSLSNAKKKHTEDSYFGCDHRTLTSTASLNAPRGHVSSGEVRQAAIADLGGSGGGGAPAEVSTQRDAPKPLDLVAVSAF